MKILRLSLILIILMGFLAEESDAAKRRRRRRSRSKIYSPPTKFELQKRKASFEIKKDKLILNHENGRTEEPIPFQTKGDKVAGMSYINLGQRHFFQVVLWAMDVKGNIGPESGKQMVQSSDVGQLLYWDLYEIVGEKIIWRQHQLLDQFFGPVNQELPPHLENAIQLSMDDNGQVSFKHGAVEQVVRAD